MGKRGPKPGTGGRPKKKPEDDPLVIVKRMASHGMTIECCAVCIGLSESTFMRDKKLMEAYKKGKQEGIDYVGNKLRQLIDKGNPAAIFFFMKTQARWRETTHFEHTGKDGKDLPNTVIVIPDNGRNEKD